MAEPTGAAIVEAKLVEWMRWASREAVDVPEALKNHIRDLCDSHEALLAALPQWRPMDGGPPVVVKEIEGRVYLQNRYGHRWCEVLGEPGVDRARRADLLVAAIKALTAPLPPAPTPEKPS